AASVSVDETVRIWNLAEGREALVLQGHDGPVLGVAVSRDGRLIASGGLDRTVRVWDASTGEPVALLEGHFEPVWALAFSPDARRLVSAGADEVVRVWDLETGREIGLKGMRFSGTDHAATWDDGSRGAALFRKCSACHTVTEDGGNKAGPTLYGVFGRRAGVVEGYSYSSALTDSDVIWDDQTIGDLFTVGPEEYAPGTKMPMQRMPSAEDRAELITFLKRITAPQE
ncbi:MAG: c-type cytochrome, partial [Kiloniellales bacterium]